MGDVLKFRRIRGKIVPIRASSIALGGLKTASAVGSVRDARMQAPKVKTNNFLKGAAIATSVVSGAISGLTLFSGGKKFIAGQGLSIGLDVLSPGLNIAAHAGKGNRKDRAKAIAKTEGVSQLLGYGTFAAAALASPQGRKHTVALLQKGSSAIRKLLKIGL